MIKMADIERGPRGEDPDKPTCYSFLCPRGRIKEVRELAEKDQAFGSLSVNTKESVRFSIGPDAESTIRGNEVTGVCLVRDIDHIVEALADRHIAGYSRLTQILFPSPEDIEAEQRFRAAINRHNEGLNRKGIN